MIPKERMLAQAIALASMASMAEQMMYAPSQRKRTHQSAPLDKKQRKSRNKSKAAKQARKRNR